MWQPDGWDATLRIGVLVPAADLGPESELQAMAPPDVRIHATRVPFGAMAPGGAMDPTIPLAPVRAFAEPPHVDEATERLAAAPIHAIGFGFTSSAYVIGPAGERDMIDRLMTRSRGIPVVAPCAAICEGLRALERERIALFDPPWFDTELDSLGADYYGAAGFQVVKASSCDLPSEQRAIEPQGVFDYVRRSTPDEADAVVFGGNGFRVVGVIDALERELGRPVLSPNQALLWGGLRAAGTAPKAVTGYGVLFGAA